MSVPRIYLEADYDHARRNLAGRFHYVVPRFGEACVCCNETTGRTVTYDPSAERMQASLLAVPVCDACDRHALRSPLAKTWQAALAVTGAGALGLGLMTRPDHPDSELVIGAIALGAAMLALAIAWVVTAAVRRRLGTRGGHHPALTVTVGRGRTVVATANDRLIERLLGHHKDARITGAQLPSARAR